MLSQSDEQLIAEVESESRSCGEEDNVEEDSSTASSSTDHTVKREDALTAVGLSIRWGEENGTDGSIIMALRKMWSEILYKSYKGKKQLTMDHFLRET